MYQEANAWQPNTNGLEQYKKLSNKLKRVSQPTSTTFRSKDQDKEDVEPKEGLPQRSGGKGGNPSEDTEGTS